jgi:hypothetical protein
MIESDILVLGGLALSPILLMAAMCFRGPKSRPIVWAGPKPSQPLFIPSAEETAKSVQRFHEAAERSMMVDFIWERYSKGRAIFLDDIRMVAGRRKKVQRAKSKPDIPKWL